MGAILETTSYTVYDQLWQMGSSSSNRLIQPKSNVEHFWRSRPSQVWPPFTLSNYRLAYVPSTYTYTEPSSVNWLTIITMHVLTTKFKHFLPHTTPTTILLLYYKLIKHTVLFFFVISLLYYAIVQFYINSYIYIYITMYSVYVCVFIYPLCV